MARQDQEFCRLETDFVLNDHRYFEMSGDEVKTYLAFWAFSVKTRREFHRISGKFLSKISGFSPKKTERILKNLQKFRLVEISENGVKVCGVASKHGRLSFKRPENLTLTGHEKRADGSDKTTVIDPKGSESKSKSKKTTTGILSKALPPRAHTRDAAPTGGAVVVDFQKLRNRSDLEGASAELLEFAEDFVKSKNGAVESPDGLFVSVVKNPQKYQAAFNSWREKKMQAKKTEVERRAIEARKLELEARKNELVEKVGGREFQAVKPDGNPIRRKCRIAPKTETVVDAETGRVLWTFSQFFSEGMSFVVETENVFSEAE